MADVLRGRDFPAEDFPAEELRAEERAGEDLRCAADFFVTPDFFVAADFLAADLLVEGLPAAADLGALRDDGDFLGRAV